MNIKFLLLYALSNIFFFLFFDLISSKLKIFSTTFFKKKEIKKHIPLIGGFLILVNFNLTFFFCDVFFTQSLKSSFFLILMISNLFFLVGYLDDRLNLGPYMKFFLFITFCFVILTNFDFLVIKELRFSFFDKVVYLHNYSLIFTIFSIFVFINALNMFDGINGQSAIYIIFIMIIFFLLSTNLIFIYFILSIILFLFFNLKNKFFIGNSGIYFIGMFISLIFIYFYNNNFIRFSEKIILAMILPGIDLIRLFFFRILSGRNPLSRDNNHWHHIISKKLGNNMTLLFTTILSTLPFILFEFFMLNLFYIVIIFVSIYFYIINFFAYKTKF
jgi:UDP-GlcNAc:undecaprenyl-phosphate GlcNAc-1-phosphate transferase